MKARVLNIDDYKDGHYKCLGIIKDDNYDVLIKSLNNMKNLELPLELNTNNSADTDGKEYYIDSISLVFPEGFSKDTIYSYIAVYVSEFL